MAVLSIHFYVLAHVYYIKCSLLAGICKFLLTFCEDFEQTAHDMEQYIESGDSIKIRKKFEELVEFHIELKELSAARIVRNASVIFVVVFLTYNFFLNYTEIRLAKECATSYGSILLAFFYFSGSFWCILLLQLYEVTLALLCQQLHLAVWLYNTMSQNDLAQRCDMTTLGGLGLIVFLLSSYFRSFIVSSFYWAENDYFSVIFYSCRLQVIQTNDFVLLLIVITTTVAFLPFFFLICHFGENVTNAFAELNVSIYGMSWFMYPVDVQKCIGPLILASHTPFHFRGIGSFKCSHETFKQVELFRTCRRDETSQAIKRIFNIHFVFCGIDYQRWIFIFYDALSYRCGINRLIFKGNHLFIVKYKTFYS